MSKKNSIFPSEADDDVVNDYGFGMESGNKSSSYTSDAVNDYNIPEADVKNGTKDTFVPRANKNIHSPADSPYYSVPVPQPDYSKQARRKSGKKHTFSKVILSVLCIFLAIVIGSCGYIYFKTDSLLGKINYVEYDNRNDYIDSSELMHSDSVLNILILGLDDDGSGTFRSDSMMLVSLDTANKKVSLTSFMRDTWVDIPGYGWAKLNASFMQGGPELVIDTLEKTYKIDIDNYVLIDFIIFTDIVNELGGIEVDVSEAEAEAMAEYLCYVEPGENVHLDGVETLWYARVRKCDSDFGRTSRQREVVTLLIEKLRQKNIKELFGFGETVLEEIQTGLTKNDMKKLIVDFQNGNNVLNYLTYDIQQMSVPADGTWWDSMIDYQAVLEIDLEENTRLLHEFIYGAPQS